MLRVGIDVSQTVYQGTGSGRYVVELVSALLRAHFDAHYVLFGGAFRHYQTLLRLGKQYGCIWSDACITEKYFFLPPRFFEFVWNDIHFLPIELFSGTLDVYHSSDWTQAPSKAKKVTTVHDMIPFLFPEYMHPRIKHAHTQRWKWIVQDHVGIIVDADSTKRDILTFFPHISSDRIWVIPLGCSEQFFQIGEARFSPDGAFFDSHSIRSHLASYGFSDKKYILTVGTLEPRKNIPRLIQAYLLLDRGLRHEYSLVVVGKQAWSSHFPDIDNVFFTGYVSEFDLPYLYAGASCFVMPSLYEGFGIPVLEAMACGVPVICSYRSSFPEIGGDDVHYIYDPENVESIRMMIEHVLLSDPSELSDVVYRAYLRACNFRWHVTARQTMEVYRTL